MRIVFLFLFFIISSENVIAQNFQINSSQITTTSVYDLSEQFSESTILKINPADFYERTTEIYDFVYADIEINGTNTELELVDAELISDNYRLKTSSQGLIQNHKPLINTLKGLIKGNPNSQVRITVSPDIFYAIIMDGEHTYFIQPVSDFVNGADKSSFVLYEEGHVLQTFPDNWCLSEEIQQSNIINPNIGDNSVEGEFAQASQACKEVELALGSDWLMFDEYGSTPAVEARNITLVNMVGVNFVGWFDFDFLFNIVEQYIVDCDGCDPWSSTTNPGQLLSSFRNWGNGASGWDLSNDMASLQTGKNLDGTTIGIAYVGSVCFNARYSVVEDWTSNMNLVRVTMAHEFGHNFNCSHDAGGSPTIMAPAVNNTNDWSTASINSLNNYVNGVNCLSTVSCSGGSAPSASIESNINDICPGTTVHFYDMSNGDVNEWDWSFPGGNPSSSSEKNPVVTYNSPGNYDVFFTATNDFGSDDVTFFDYISVSNNGAAVLFYDDFEEGQTEFNIENPDNSITWEVSTSGYTRRGQRSINIDNFSYNSFDEKDHLISDEISLVGRDDVRLEFDHAYARGNSSLKDSLRISISTNGGSTFPNTVFAATENGSQNFATHPDLFPSPFVPEDGEDWCFGDSDVDCISINLDAFTDEENFAFRMTNSTGNGNTMLLDNVMLTSACYDLAPPTAGFGSDEFDGCAPFEVQFFEEAEGFVSSYQWEFPGGTPSSSNEPNPIVTYEVAGIYNVSLEVENDAGSDIAFFPGYIEVSNYPVADGDVSIFGMDIECFNFSSFATSYLWEFGDNNTSTDENPTHTYASDGTYTITLHSINECGEDIYTFDIEINSVPVAGFSSDVVSGCAPFEVNFINQSSANVESFDWVFPGGSPASSTDENPTVVYNTPGIYDVSLIVINGAGFDEIILEDYITVLAEPEASFGFTISNFIVDFTNSSSFGSTYAWDFGDNSNSTEENPSHTYAEDGTYTVTLTVENECGTDVFTEEIVISSLPVANFSVASTVGCVPFEVQFTDLSSSNATSWEWSFPGGTPSSSTAENPLITYNAAGNYDVSLTVTAPAGSNTLSQENYIIVNDIPSSGFNFTTAETTVSFSNTSSGANSYLWEFGDNTTSTEVNPSHTYDIDGNYTVILTAINECGESQTVVNVEVATPPVAAFTSSAPQGCVPHSIDFVSMASENTSSVKWIFEGGEPSITTETNPTVLYNNAGTYPVTFIAFSNGGSDTVNQLTYVSLDDVPESGFDYIVNDLTIQFVNESNNADAYQWFFDDNGESVEIHPIHTYETGGFYNVMLIAENTCGFDTTIIEIATDGLPMADFSMNANVGCVPFEVEYTNLSENATSFNWSFEGGQPANSTDENPVITYLERGVYGVTLEASNGTTGNTLILENVVVTNDVPDANFSYEQDNAMITFFNSSDYGSSYVWNFGDDQSSNEKNPIHTYENNGEFTVELIVFNECGADTITQVLSITGATSIVNNGSSSSFEVFPNPTNNNININADALKFELKRIVLMDLYGKKLYNKSHNIQKGEKLDLNISMQDWADGSYLLIFEGNNTREIVKVVKIN